MMVEMKGREMSIVAQSAVALNRLLVQKLIMVKSSSTGHGMRPRQLDHNPTYCISRQWDMQRQVNSWWIFDRMKDSCLSDLSKDGPYEKAWHARAIKKARLHESVSSQGIPQPEIWERPEFDSTEWSPWGVAHKMSDIYEKRSWGRGWVVSDERYSWDERRPRDEWCPWDGWCKWVAHNDGCPEEIAEVGSTWLDPTTEKVLKYQRLRFFIHAKPLDHCIRKPVIKRKQEWDMELTAAMPPGALPLRGGSPPAEESPAAVDIFWWKKNPFWWFFVKRKGGRWMVAQGREVYLLCVQFIGWARISPPTAISHHNKP